ncbi:uncharacterized protein PV09_03148 [Verruconis gallopava]|uniref:6-methylsalicylate decarboxylase n=1 Tax=Verruconis gallopava TaxID=253628 RepID=A0A0D2AG77_9PEZI|nr:uncharacterized protein PV09_03148 [Verruconis gallopava]KIW05963.1 hypothetical protein PV09_03148 [Verruconis gallopava]
MNRLSAISSSALQQMVLKKTAQPALLKVDTHHHYVPDFYAKAVEDAGGDPSGWATPNWSKEHSKEIMERLGVQTAILSVTAPGACILKGQNSYDLARRLNEYGASLRNECPERFGFFASLPSLLDTEAALAEIKYAIDVLHADGVTLFTKYGEGNVYLGHPLLQPIWAELNRREAVVFVHPSSPVDTNRINAKMPQPMIDYPHETTRAAMDMILMGTRQKFPKTTVILSHAGGTLPYLISRVITPLKQVPDTAASVTLGTTYDRAIADLRSFYYDLALSSSKHVLDMLLAMVPHDHILYGSDYPYAPLPAYSAFRDELEKYPMADDIRKDIYSANAIRLIPRLLKLKQSM